MSIEALRALGQSIYADNAELLASIENSVGIHRCRYCEGHPVMDAMAPGVYECPECSYEETEQ